MTLSIAQKFGLVATGLLTALSATPAHAIDAGCYAPEVVRNATWKATGDAQQFTIIKAENNASTSVTYVTSNKKGTESYIIDAPGKEENDDRLCVTIKMINPSTNISNQRPNWANLPEGSPTAKYIAQQESENNIRIIFGAKSVVRAENGKEYAGPQILVTKAGNLIEGMVVGAILNSDKSGNGRPFAHLVNMTTNANYDALAMAQNRVQTAAISYTPVKN